MIRVCVVCEGQTEVEFVNTCLAPYLLASNVVAYASVLQAPSGNHRGGRVSVERLVKFISHEYHAVDRITTLVDYYGFQDLNGRSKEQLQEAILRGVLQARNARQYDARFIFPYVQMHEFEALLFTDTEAFAWVEDGWNRGTQIALTAVAQAFENPEHINNSQETAPSKRILQIFPQGTYSKVVHGALIAESVGIEAIRQKCPGFDAWVARLQAWGTAVPA